MPPRQSKITVFTVDDALPAVGQAASLALTLLRKTKTATMADLETAVAAGDGATMKMLRSMWLSPDQHHLLDRHREVTHAVSPDTPRRTIAICDTCGEHLVVAGTVPSRCALTLGCEGTYAKVAPAKSELVSADDIPGQDDEPDDHDRDERHDHDDRGGTEPDDEPDAGELPPPWGDEDDEEPFDFDE